MNDYNTTVTVLRGKHGNKPGAAKSEAAINAARRRGEAIATEQKFGAATNKHTGTTLNTTKLDRETEELKHERVPLELGKAIMKGRNDKGLTQKDFATKICEKIQVVNEYENGKAVPNHAILAKMERVLEIKLRGKDRGQPLAPKVQTAAAAPAQKGRTGNAK